MLRTLVERELRVQTKRSVLGLAWPAVAPALLLALYVFVFKGVFKIPVRHYPEYLFAALLPWTLLVQSLNQAIGSLSQQSDLIRRARFPYEFLPLASVGMMTVYFLFDEVIFVAYLGARGFLSWPMLALLPICVLGLILFVASLSLLLALIDVYNHDLRRVLGNLLTVWFFLVPVVYRPGMVPSQVRFLRSVDPMNLIVTQFREVLIIHHLSRPAHLGVMLALAIAAFVASIIVFRRLAVDLPKDV